jgi:hypothetical protein
MYSNNEKARREAGLGVELLTGCNQAVIRCMVRTGRRRAH